MLLKDNKIILLYTFLLNMKRLSSKSIAWLIFGTTFLWLASGQIPFLKKKAENTDKPSKEASLVPSVEIVNSQAKEIWQEVALFGVTESDRKVTLKSKTRGMVETINVKEGEFVKKDDIILVLSPEDRKTNLDSARALLQQRQLEYDVAKSLKNSGYQSKTRLAEKNAELREAEARLSAAQLPFSDTLIKAPFDGILQQLNIEIGDFVHQSGEPIGIFLDNSKLIAVGHVSEKKISDVQLGNKAKVETVSGIQAEGNVRYISKVADNITRTFKVEIELDNKGNRFLEGVTARIVIPTKTVMAHQVKPSYFALDESGEIGLKTLGENNIVEFNALEVVKEDKEGVWVLGLPDKANIISLGQSYLKAGDVAKVADK